MTRSLLYNLRVCFADISLVVNGKFLAEYILLACISMLVCESSCLSFNITASTCSQDIVQQFINRTQDHDTRNLCEMLIGHSTGSDLQQLLGNGNTILVLPAAMERTALHIGQDSVLFLH